MLAPADLAPSCDHSTGCITCGDEAVEMRVLTVEADGLVACAGPDGTESEVEVGLVTPVEPGDVVLVHAGAAIGRLDEEEAA